MPPASGALPLLLGGVFSVILLGGCDRLPVTGGWPEGGVDAGDFPPPGDAPAAGLGEDVEEVAGGHARLVWTRVVKGAPDDVFHREKRHTLYAFDSREEGGERVLVAGPHNFRKPFISPDGNWVFYTQLSNRSCWRVPFVGGEPELLGAGVPLTVWRDPDGGDEWLYVGEDVARMGGNLNSGRVVRRRLWDLKEEPVWEGAPVTLDNFTLSRDGTRAAAGFPWPNFGVADLTAGSWEKFHNGCWPTFLPGSDGVVAVFDGAHRNMTLFSDAPSLRWRLPLTPHPDLAGTEIYHPMWSPHPRLMVFSGPFQNAGEGETPNIFQGGNEIEIYLARLGPGLDEVEETLAVTDNGQADFSPYLWVDPGGLEMDWGAALEGKPEWGRMKDLWPVVDERALLLWRGFDATNEIPVAAGGANRRMTLLREGLAMPGASHELVLAGGAATVSDGAFEEAFAELCQSPLGGAIEIAIRQGDLGDGSGGTIMGIGDQMALEISAGSLTWRCGEAAPVVVAAPDPGRPYHLVFTFSPEGDGEVHHEGKAIGTFGLGAPLASLGEVGSGNLVFGGGGWNGRILRFALHGQALVTDESLGNRIALRDQLDLEPVPGRITCKGELIEVATIPKPESLGAYRDALTTARYRVIGIDTGGFGGEMIDIVHWALIDRKPSTRVAGLKVGETYDLVIERFEEHPELASQRIESFLDPIPLYYDVGWERGVE